jgi:type II secretory pathway component GspD/PulD (secretin)
VVTAYEISTRESETTVRLKDGETLVIGGLYNSEDLKSTLKVPLLGDIPLIGNLFKSTSTSKDETEIIVLLRPTIAKNE